MAIQAGEGKGGPVSEINVTPLVDIMLVLLIVMMLVAPLLAGVPVRLPAATHLPKPVRVVYLKADTDAPYDAVMTVMDQLHEARVDNVGLITETPPRAGVPAAGGL